MSHSTSELIGRLRPVIEILLTSHRVSPERGRELLEDLVRTLQLKHESIADPEAWLVASLHRAVQRLDLERELDEAETTRSAES